MLHQLLYKHTNQPGGEFKREDNLIIDRLKDGSTRVRFTPPPAGQTYLSVHNLINAYQFGAPPHAGIAPGLDRLIMLLAGEKDIREVIAFPMSSGGQTSVMDAPSELSKEQLKELHLKLE